MTPTSQFRITGLSVLSAAGIGPDALGDRLRRLASGEKVLAHATPTGDGGDYDGVPGQLSAVPGFDITDFVPKKGTRYLDRTTKLGIAASAQLKQSLTDTAWERTGVAMGSMAGSVRSSIELDASVLTGNGIDLVNPATFPNTTMNCCASQIAIWHRLRGPNSTLANGTISAISALRYATRLIRCGHAERMLVGGVEELSPHTAWGTRLGKDVDDSVFIGEGAAMLAVQAAGQDAEPSLATLSACEVLFAPERDEAGYATALGRAVDRVLASSGVGVEDIDLVLPGTVGTSLWSSEATVVDRFNADRVDVRAAVGECGSAMGAMQLAAALLLDGSGGLALVTGIDVSGAVGAVVLTVGGPEQ
jgi:3-oxoacyl-[acyl-carrier-protein] synthase II